VDWPAMRKHYGALVEQASTREDVNWILGELIFCSYLFWHFCSSSRSGEEWVCTR
jgi:hypothetical protein